MVNFVLYNGDVYSSADPFATAASVSGDVVDWVGGDEAAQAMSSERIDLHDDFAAPAMITTVDLRSEEATPRDFLAAGIVSVHAIGTDEQLRTFAEHAGPLRVVGYSLDGTRDRRAHVGLPDDRPDAAVYVILDDLEALNSYIEALADADFKRHAARNGWRVFANVQIPEDFAGALGQSPLPLTVDPRAFAQPVGALLREGAQVSFASSCEPWEAMRQAIFAPGSTVSGRAAFNCLTRFAERALGNFGGGVIAPGSRADIARWKVENLVVQAADERVAAWSTDPRSGTPGLPDLTPGTPLPELVSLWSAGEPVELDS